MRKKIYLLLFPLLVAFSSCTMVLVNHFDGGHSPMMQLDGRWKVVKNQETVNGVTSDVENVKRCWFNATKDVGNYCEGTWTEANPGIKPEFLWGYTNNWRTFILRTDNKDKNWDVKAQDKDNFIIERLENGVIYHLEFSRE